MRSIEFTPAPEQIEQRVRAICMALPEVHEPAVVFPPGACRWRVRDATFATLFCRDGISEVEFIARGADFETLVHVGAPFKRAPWGGDVVLVELGDTTDWDEVAEVIADSYCLMAPKKLAALVRPPTA